MNNRASYIIRFDDICPTMNWEIWDQVEAILDKYDIQPIVAVIPENHDPKLNFSPPNPLFWSRVRAWKDKGWCIALHGYQHIYHTRSSGILKLNSYSEFAGIDFETQRNMIERALEIFSEQNIDVDAWIAPAHSFDRNTVLALRHNGITVISDGFFWRPVKYLEVTWLPQQLWHFRPMPFGVWTVCQHHNGYGPQEVSRLENWISTYKDHLISHHDALKIQPREISTLDRIFSFLFYQSHKRKSSQWKKSQKK